MYFWYVEFVVLLPNLLSHSTINDPITYKKTSRKSGTFL